MPQRSMVETFALPIMLSFSFLAMLLLPDHKHVNVGGVV